MTKAFGQAVRSARDRAGLTQRVLAEAVGVHFSYLSKIENGHAAVAPSEDLIRRLAETLGADAEDWLALSGKIDVELLAQLAASDVDSARLLRTLPRLTPERIAALWTAAQQPSEIGLDIRPNMC